MASNGLLDQNERLRAAIVAEEREKFQSEKVKNADIFYKNAGNLDQKVRHEKPEHSCCDAGAREVSYLIMSMRQAGDWSRMQFTV